MEKYMNILKSALMGKMNSKSIGRKNWKFELKNIQFWWSFIVTYNVFLSWRISYKFVNRDLELKEYVMKC
jgi:hypothetical protein